MRNALTIAIAALAIFMHAYETSDRFYCTLNPDDMTDTCAEIDEDAVSIAAIANPLADD